MALSLGSPLDTTNPLDPIQKAPNVSPTLLSVVNLLSAFLKKSKLTIIAGNHFKSFSNGHTMRNLEWDLVMSHYTLDLSIPTRRSWAQPAKAFYPSPLSYFGDSLVTTVGLILASVKHAFSRLLCSENWPKKNVIFFQLSGDLNRHLKKSSAT